MSGGDVLPEERFTPTNGQLRRWAKSVPLEERQAREAADRRRTRYCECRAEFDRASRGVYSREYPTDAHAILATLGDLLGPASDERDALVVELVREINGRAPHEDPFDFGGVA